MTKLMGVHMFATGNSYGERAPLARNYIIAKRVLDLLIAGTALVMFSPLLAFICIGIKLEGRSQAVLVRQRAVFTGGEFAIYKFATTASQRGFRRVTRVGALLQNTGMDELPQLLNVLCGQMSMVGPRPRVVDPKRDCLIRCTTRRSITSSQELSVGHRLIGSDPRQLGWTE